MPRLARKESEDRVKGPREKRGARGRKGSKGREETSVERGGPGGRLSRQYSASQDCLVPGAEQRQRLGASGSRWNSVERLNIYNVSSPFNIHNIIWTSPQLTQCSQDFSSDSDNGYSDNEEELELRQPSEPKKLQRSNSIVLEEQEKKEKLKILNVFGMTSKVRKWKSFLDGKL